MAGPDPPSGGSATSPRRSRRLQGGDVPAPAVAASPPPPGSRKRKGVGGDVAVPVPVPVPVPASPPRSMKRKRDDDAEAAAASQASPQGSSKGKGKGGEVAAYAAPGASPQGSGKGKGGNVAADAVPASPPRSRKRKRLDVAATATAAAAAGSASPPRPATRRSAWMDDAVQWARDAAAGTLWTKLGIGRAGDERMREVILEVRRARSVLAADDPFSPYMERLKMMYKPGTRISERIARLSDPLAIHLLSRNKEIGIDEVECQASVPEWENAPSEKYIADYKTETLQKLGTMVVCPLNMDVSAIDESTEKRKEKVDKCRCSQAGSEACARVHTKRARTWLKNQLGNEAFRNCGLDDMGEQVLKSWTAKDIKKLDDMEKLIPQNEHGKFMKIASKQFSSARTNDLALYYYNVFLPRRLARLTREGPKNVKDVDTDEENGLYSGSTSKRPSLSGSGTKRI